MPNLKRGTALPPPPLLPTKPRKHIIALVQDYSETLCLLALPVVNMFAYLVHRLRRRHLFLCAPKTLTLNIKSVTLNQTA